MSEDFKDKVVIITGAGTGLGRQTSIELSQKGAIIILASNDPESIKKTEAEIHALDGKALAIETDVSNEESVKQMIKKTIDSYGTIDILVNNAAIYPSKPFEEVSVEEWDSVFAVNSRGYFICAQQVLPYMKKNKWGRIINISSITFFLGFENIIHYVSTKGSTIGFTRALAREVGKHGITVNSVAPGAIPTAAEEIHPDREAYSKRIITSQSVKFRGSPADIANAVTFFASERSGFITGQNLLVDGGWAND